MLMMHLVRPPQSPEISNIGPGKPTNPLVDDHFMHQKISDSIQAESSPYGNQPIIPVNDPQHDKKPAGNGKEKKEIIIFFKESRTLLVMILVEVPEEPMHDKPVQTPAHPLHKHEGGQRNQDIQHKNHENRVGLYLRNARRSRKNAHWINIKFTANLFRFSIFAPSKSANKAALTMNQLK